ncbi:hypothetical protein J6590_075115 [Homalodisca vitripennis]|nr:hypothetical protein J6590_075115 [Homalodisca vitripennis]
MAIGLWYSVSFMLTIQGLRVDFLRHVDDDNTKDLTSEDCQSTGYCLSRIYVNCCSDSLSS